MRRGKGLALCVVLALAALILAGCSSAGKQPEIRLWKTDYILEERITISYENAGEGSLIALCKGEAANGAACVWAPVSGDGSVSFSLSDVGEAGVYQVVLRDQEDDRMILASRQIQITDGDRTDYGVSAAAVEVSAADGISHTEVTVTPSNGGRLEYRLYWSRDGARLGGYDPIKTVEHAGAEPFVVVLNDGLFMPAEANGMEIAVSNGASSSYFVSMGDELKLKPSELLYSFPVISDMHVNLDKPEHTRQLQQALQDIQEQSPNAIGIFTCGDHTDCGRPEEYDLLLETVKAAGEGLPRLHYALGNHDIAYFQNYEAQVALFQEKMGLTPYYAVEYGEARFIFLGSDAPLTADGSPEPETQMHYGRIDEAQLSWLREQLSQTDRSRPTFILLHQPLMDTVSGSLYSKYPETQTWYGVCDAAQELRALLREYPNAVLFTGHTHWTLESEQPVLLGRGADANFVNVSSTAYLWSDANESKAGSEGFYVDVYRDYMVLRGRNFLDRTWMAAVQLVIPIVQ